MNLTVNSVQPQVTPHFGASIVFSDTKEGREAKKYYENSIKSLSEADIPVVQQLKNDVFNSNEGLVLEITSPRSIYVYSRADEGPNAPKDHGHYQNLEVHDIHKTPKYDLIKEFFPALLNIAANARKDSHAGSVSRSGLNIGEMGASDRIFWA